MKKVKKVKKKVVKKETKVEDVKVDKNEVRKAQLTQVLAQSKIQCFDIRDQIDACKARDNSLINAYNKKRDEVAKIQD